jgi:hypothetical protein
MGLVRELPKKGNLTRKFIPLSALAAASISIFAFAAAEQRADLFRSMLAYGGTYTFDGAKVEHHIDMS